MRSNHFTIIRCLIALVHMDQRTPHEHELNIIRNFAFRQGLTPEQRKILKAEVLKSDETGFDIFASLESPLDREKTLAVLRVILHIDGTYTAEEQNTYQQLQLIHQQKLSATSMEVKSSSQQQVDDFGKELIARDSRLQFYQELQEMGEYLAQKPYGLWGRFNPYIYWYRWNIQNRPLFWFLIIFIGVSIAARMVLPHLLK